MKKMRSQEHMVPVGGWLVTPRSTQTSTCHVTQGERFLRRRMPNNSLQRTVTVITLPLTAKKQRKDFIWLKKKDGCYLSYTPKPLKSRHWHNTDGKSLSFYRAVSPCQKISELWKGCVSESQQSGKYISERLNLWLKTLFLTSFTTNFGSKH